MNLALPLMPDVIRKTGVVTTKKSPDILLAINLISEDGRYDQLYLSNYAFLKVRDEVARLGEVGDVTIFGERDYSMRIWIDPDRLVSRNLTAGDVADAVREQNAAVALGQNGHSPALRGLEYQIPLTTVGRLVEADDFASIKVNATPEGGLVRLKDVARVELGAKNMASTPASMGCRRRRWESFNSPMPMRSTPRTVSAPRSRSWRRIFLRGSAM